MAQKLIRSALSLHSNRLPPRSCQIKHSFVSNWCRSTRCMSSQPPPMPQGDGNLLLSEEDRKDFFRLNDLFTVEDLFNARVHFGHKEGSLNPHMRPYIFGKRLGVLIIDLEETAKKLHRALEVTAEIAYRKGLIMFFHQPRQNAYLVESLARECQEFAYCRRWDDASFTNSHQLFKAITRLPDLVVLMSTRDVLNTPHSVVSTAASMLVPTVGICDTNSDPTLITYPIPGNDDTPQSIELYCRLFKTAVLNGKEKQQEIIATYGEDVYYKTIDP